MVLSIKNLWAIENKNIITKSIMGWNHCIMHPINAVITAYPIAYAIIVLQVPFSVKLILNPLGKAYKYGV